MLFNHIKRVVVSVYLALNVADPWISNHMPHFPTRLVEAPRKV
jgi:hypothetical protein